MKFKYILTVAVAATAMAFTSCSLDEKVESFSQPDTFYKNVTQCQLAVNSCYIPIKNIYTGTMILVTEATTDLAWCNSGTQDATLDISPAQPRYGSTMWTQGYRGVMYCNAVLAGIDRSEFAEEDKIPLICEARVMRAMYYYVLTCVFGDVPYYTVDVADEKIQYEIAHLPRMSAIDTRDALIEDLLDILPLVEQKRTSDVAGNRSGAAMGWMLVAKMAMWNKKWEVALNAIAQLEEIYGDLSQYPIADIPFRYKNTPESIFEIQHEYVQGGTSYTSNLACFCMPHPRSGSNYAGVSIPELGDQSSCWNPMHASNFMFGTLSPGDNGDLRDAINIVHGEYNGLKFNGSHQDGISNYQFMGPKFWCPNLNGSYDSNNYKIFRYADALLMKAECLCMLEKDLDTAAEYLNMVKRRAGLPDFKPRNFTKLFNEIVDERARELFGEFQRKFDLVRWGLWYERTSVYGYTKVLNNLEPYKEYYPIPDKEVVYSGYALDNKAYGM